MARIVKESERKAKMKIQGHEVESQFWDGLPHGGMLRIKGGFGKKPSEAAAIIQGFIDNITDGLALLESGRAKFASGARPIPGSTVETFDFLDALTGDHVMLWRIRCEEITTH
jgi:hypothetical protein